MCAEPIFDPYAAQRHDMVEKQLRARGIRDARVLAAMERVARHEFLSHSPGGESCLPQAYEDHPIPIGPGQTISQPYIVACMAETAEIQPADVVLEVGTGSGYQTAVLAELAAEVFSIERDLALAATARKLLAHLHYANVIVEVGDGSQGLPAAAPFNAIIVSAAAPRIPPALIEQLKEGGRLVIPLGGPNDQYLYLVRKQNGRPLIKRLVGCKFVPLIGSCGYPPMV